MSLTFYHDELYEAVLRGAFAFDFWALNPFDWRIFVTVRIEPRCVAWALPAIRSLRAVEILAGEPVVRR
jgi:hypothetical protein